MFQQHTPSSKKLSFWDIRSRIEGILKVIVFGGFCESVSDDEYCDNQMMTFQTYHFIILKKNTVTFQNYPIL